MIKRGKKGSKRKEGKSGADFEINDVREGKR